VQSLGRDHRTRTLRRESFCFVLFSRAADWLISLVGCCFRGAPGGRALPSIEALAIQEARIESKLDRLADFDFFEIGMLGI